jgi:RHS repeat-associated protein
MYPEYDTKGRLFAVKDYTGSAYLHNATYNSAGQVTGDSLSLAQVNETFSYDSQRMQLTGQTAIKGAATLMSLTYGYQAQAGQTGANTIAGNASQIMSISGTISGQTESAAYTYDNLGRLVTSSQTTNGASYQRRFDYDRWSNRTGVWNAVSGGTQIQSIILEQSFFTPTNRISSVTQGASTVNYTYDSAGNVTNDGPHNYQYDAESRLVSVDGGTTAQYSYDHQNRRYKKVTGGSGTHYVWVGTRVLSEHSASTGVVQVSYIYAGSRMVAKSTASGLRYILNDRLSARLVLDQSGTVIGRQAHLPFGEEIGTTGEADKHRFISYERDSETNTDYAVNRQYEQTIGRFNRPDPYRDSSSLDKPQSHNRYVYAANDPVNAVDPIGLFIVPVTTFFPISSNCITEIIRGDGLVAIISICNSGVPDPFGYDDAPKKDKKQSCGDYLAEQGFGLLLGHVYAKVAEAIFSEASGGSEREASAIGSTILNRLWFLNNDNLGSDTHGFGPRDATIEQVLGAPNQFAGYKADGTLKNDTEWKKAHKLPSNHKGCQKLFQAYSVAYGLSAGRISDPFASQGGSWYFQQNQFGPGGICRDCSGSLGGLVGAHHFYTFPYWEYVNGDRLP